MIWVLLRLRLLIDLCIHMNKYGIYWTREPGYSDLKIIEGLLIREIIIIVYFCSKNEIKFSYWPVSENKCFYFAVHKSRLYRSWRMSKTTPVVMDMNQFSATNLWNED